MRAVGKTVLKNDESRQRDFGREEDTGDIIQLRGIAQIATDLIETPMFDVMNDAVRTITVRRWV